MPLAVDDTAADVVTPFSAEMGEVAAEGNAGERVPPTPILSTN